MFLDLPNRIFGSATAITCRNTRALTKLNAFPIFIINLDPDWTRSVANPEFPRRGGGRQSHRGRGSLLFGKKSCWKLHENGRNWTQWEVHAPSAPFGSTNAFKWQWRIYIVKFRRPPRGPNSFNFMQFLGKFGKIVCCPLPRVGASTSGKSWIRHWVGLEQGNSRWRYTYAQN